MKKLKIVTMIVLMTMTAGCGNGYEEYDKNLMKFAKDGSISETIQEAFDETVYDEDGLEASIEEEITQYDENYNGTVEMKKCKVRKNQAVVQMEYDSALSYTQFNHVGIFQGSLSSFTESEYHNYADLKDADGTVTSLSTVVASGEDYSIVALDMDCIVEVSGKICYVSDGVELISKKAANVTVSDEAYAYIVYK